MKNLIVFLLFISAISFAERRVVDDIQYIHQILDTEYKDENGVRMFYGFNACGPTSATMLVQYHNVQPISQKGRGWYIFNPYIAITDKLGNNYSETYARDWDGISEDNTYYKHHPNSVYGAHGHIVVNSGTEANQYWSASLRRLSGYLENHGLIDSLYKNINVDLYKKIKNNIDAGLPLICSFRGTHAKYGTIGHYLVVVGYDDNNGNKLILHDPNGDVNGDWSGSDATAGNFVEYDYPNIQTSITFNRFIEVHPVGIYSWFPGWRQGSLSPKSQPFLDCYNNQEKHGGAGREVFGIPWNNGSGGPWVHPWPNGTSDMNTVYVQDFINYDCHSTDEEGHWWQLVLNQKEGKVYPLHSQILSYWHNNSGYLNYGEPKSYEYNKRNKKGELIVVQEFEKNNKTHYIGYNTVSGISREYSFFEILPFDGGNSSDDQVYIVDPDAQVSGYTNEPEMVFDSSNENSSAEDPDPIEEPDTQVVITDSETEPLPDNLSGSVMISSGYEYDKANGWCFIPADTLTQVTKDRENIYYLCQAENVKGRHQLRIEVYRDNVLWWPTDGKWGEIGGQTGVTKTYVPMPQLQDRAYISDLNKSQVEVKVLFFIKLLNEGKELKLAEGSYHIIDMSVSAKQPLPNKPQLFQRKQEYYNLMGQRIAYPQRHLPQGVFITKMKTQEGRVLNVSK